MDELESYYHLSAVHTWHAPSSHSLNIASSWSPSRHPRNTCGTRGKSYLQETMKGLL